ncbi:preprotein translocase subunit SecE [Corynebacterium falsenii]|uniref:preprotein translocase subunit SecE n=1 Tax=Corynebacterium falsenii TaxID=108486 RepID=UPI00234C44DA|nr:preprotein translocase subunit SecE [Corynebacterium falsenii]MDC7103207.1 preprotein translocase subunit SecE [Corynebacterium falsenii]
MSDESTKSPAAGTPGDGGALRPSGKRQVAGQATTAAATSRSKAPEVVKTRRNPLTAIFDFFRGVFSEIGKVIWPTGREMVNYTLIVLAFLIFMIALIAGVDWVATFLLQKILA